MIQIMLFASFSAFYSFFFFRLNTSVGWRVVDASSSQITRDLSKNLTIDILLSQLSFGRLTASYPVLVLNRLPWLQACARKLGQDWSSVVYAIFCKLERHLKIKVIKAEVEWSFWKSTLSKLFRMNLQ